MKRRFSLITPLIVSIFAINYLYAAQTIDAGLLKSINSDGDETSCSFSENQRYLIFARKNKDKKDSDLYYTEFKNGMWSEASAATELNSDSDDIDPCLTRDGKYVLFSSNRTGSLKSGSSDRPSFDIYYSEKKGATWGKPELLFGAVNTNDDETNPSLVDGSKILYFTRTRPDSPGSSTIIRVVKRKGSWEDVQTSEVSKNPDRKVFSLIKSAYSGGAFITAYTGSNTSNRDVYFTDNPEDKSSLLTKIDSISTEGDEQSLSEIDSRTVIVSSNNGGISGSYDFFLKKTGAIRKNIETKKITPIDYTLVIEKSGSVEPGDIKILILFFSSASGDLKPIKTETMEADSSGIIRFRSSERTKRILVLPATSGIKPFAVELFTDNDSITTSTINIEAAETKMFSVKPVYFEFNSSSLKIADIPYIYELAEQMKLSGNKKLELAGYADGKGSLKGNTDISLKRAETVKEFLVKAGIRADRIYTKGYGFVKNNDSDTSQYHRRVDFSLSE